MSCMVQHMYTKKGSTITKRLSVVAYVGTYYVLQSTRENCWSTSFLTKISNCFGNNSTTKHVVAISIRKEGDILCLKHLQNEPYN